MMIRQQAPRHLRVFISSPSDVAAERALAQGILSTLPYDPFLRGRITIEIVAWDGPLGSVPMTVSMTPQDAITRGLARPSECDIIIVILWRRLGTPLPDSYRRPDGTCYQSGTEWEYEDALAASRQPLILLYRRTTGTEIDSNEPDPIEARVQGERVRRFFDAFQDADGSARGGINTYSSPEDFGPRLDFHLREILSQVVAANNPPADLTAQTMRLDAATPREMVVGRATQVRVQVCLPSSVGLLRNKANDDGCGQMPEQLGDSLMPILFRRDAALAAPVATPVSVDLFAPNHTPVHSTEELLLLPSHDSGIVSFSIQPRQVGVATMRVALRQSLHHGQPVTSGTVMLESTIVKLKTEVEFDDFWQVASRLLGNNQAVALGSDVATATQPPHARLTMKIVEDAERKKIEKYLTLEIPLLCSMLPLLQDGQGTLFSPSGQQAAGTKLFEDLKLILIERLRHDYELFSFLRDHTGMSDVDLVLLIEDRIAAVVSDQSRRVVAAIVAKIGLYEFVGENAILPPLTRDDRSNKS